MYVFIMVTEWPPIGKITAHLTYDIFSWYKYLIVNLVFPTSVFWSGNLFLIAPFPDLCLLVPCYAFVRNNVMNMSIIVIWKFIGLFIYFWFNVLTFFDITSPIYD